MIERREERETVCAFDAIYFICECRRSPCDFVTYDFAKFPILRFLLSASFSCHWNAKYRVVVVYLRVSIHSTASARIKWIWWKKIQRQFTICIQEYSEQFIHRELLSSLLPSSFIVWLIFLSMYVVESKVCTVVATGEVPFSMCMCDTYNSLPFRIPISCCGTVP